MHNDEEISLEEVYASIRGLKNRKSPGVCKKEEVINRWKEYFESLLKGDTSVVQAVKRVEHSKVSNCFSVLDNSCVEN